MGLTSLDHRIARARQEASARIAPVHQRRIPEELCDQVASCIDEGAFAAAARLLEAAPNSAGDERALGYLGIARLGLDEYDSALEAWTRAGELLRVRTAWCELNRAVVLALLGRFDEALQAVATARRLNPGSWLAYLVEIAVLEKRWQPEDRDREVAVAAELTSNWVDWHKTEPGHYLAFDIDYSRLRNASGGRVFEAAFGIHPNALIAAQRGLQPGRKE